jgi:hypothetical protein
MNRPRNSSRPPTPDGQPPVGRTFRTLLGWLLLMMGVLLLYTLFRSAERPEWTVTYTEYLQLLEEGKIASATIVKSRFNDYEFRGVLKEPITLIRDGRPRQVRYIVTKLGVLDAETERRWAEKGIQWTYESGDNPWWDSLISVLPWVALIAIYFLLLQRMQVGTTRNIFSFGKARVRISDPLTAACHLRRCCRSRGSQGGAARDHRFPAESGALPCAWGKGAQRGAPGRSARHGQDAAGARRCRRSWGALLLHLRG